MIIISLILFLLAGIFEGVMDTLHFHWSSFKKKHMKFDSFFWNPELSWMNKWKNKDKKYGEEFLFSSTILVWTTDAWHMFKFLRNISLIMAVFCLVSNDLHINNILYSALVYIINRLGFNLIYNLIYK